MGALGHTIENYNAFKYRVHEFIESKAVTFTTLGPNLRTNPIPTHAEPSISVVEESVEQEMIEKVEEIQTPIDVIGVQLRKYGLIPTNNVDKEACISGDDQSPFLLDLLSFECQKHANYYWYAF